MERSASHTDFIFSPALDPMKRRDLWIRVWGKKMRGGELEQAESELVERSE